MLSFSRTHEIAPSADAWPEGAIKFCYPLAGRVSLGSRRNNRDDKTTSWPTKIT